jgi:hypothetical protein
MHIRCECLRLQRATSPVSHRYLALVRVVTRPAGESRTRLPRLRARDDRNVRSKTAALAGSPPQHAYKTNRFATNILHLPRPLYAQLLPLSRRSFAEVNQILHLTFADSNRLSPAHCARALVQCPSRCASFGEIERLHTNDISGVDDRASSLMGVISARIGFGRFRPR